MLLTLSKNENTRLFLLIAAILGATGVALGAYGAHGLTKWASPTQIDYFQLAVLYQLLHAITLLSVSILSLFVSSRLLLASQISFVMGIFCFSGSLYFYVFTGTKAFAMLTPFGGLLLIIAWLLLATTFIKKSKKC